MIIRALQIRKTIKAFCEHTLERESKYQYIARLNPSEAEWKSLGYLADYIKEVSYLTITTGSVSEVPVGKIFLLLAFAVQRQARRMERLNAKIDAHRNEAHVGVLRELREALQSSTDKLKTYIDKYKEQKEALVIAALLYPHDIGSIESRQYNAFVAAGLYPDIREAKTESIRLLTSVYREYRGNVSEDNNVQNRPRRRPMLDTILLSSSPVRGSRNASGANVDHQIDNEIAHFMRQRK